MLAGKRLALFPSETDAYALIGKALSAMERLDEARVLLGDLEERVSALSLVSVRLNKLYAGKSVELEEMLKESLVSKLSGWLDNIHRLKTHADR